MSAYPNHRKASKGTVQIKNSNDRLQLVFTYDGKRHYLSTGLRDTVTNRKAAEIKARQIELDITSGNFDVTLQKYKPQLSQLTSAPDTASKSDPTIISLWQAYIEDRSASVKETTKYYYAAFTKLFELIGDVPLLEALQVKAKLGKVTTIYQTKRALMQLSAACKWGKKYGLLDSNPYEGMANELPKYHYQLEPHPNAFTEAEREKIIEAFKNHRGNWNGRGYAGMGYAQG